MHSRAEEVSAERKERDQIPSSSPRPPSTRHIGDTAEGAERKEKDQTPRSSPRSPSAMHIGHTMEGGNAVYHEGQYFEGGSQHFGPKIRQSERRPSADKE